MSLTAIIAAKRKESTDSRESLNGPEKKKSRKSKIPQRYVDFVDDIPGIDDHVPEQETSFKLEPTWDDDDLIENDIDGDVNTVSGIELSS